MNEGKKRLLINQKKKLKRKVRKIVTARSRERGVEDEERREKENPRKVEEGNL